MLSCGSRVASVVRHDHGDPDYSSRNRMHDKSDVALRGLAFDGSTACMNESICHQVSAQRWTGERISSKFGVARARHHASPGILAERGPSRTICTMARWMRREGSSVNDADSGYGRMTRGGRLPQLSRIDFYRLHEGELISASGVDAFRSTNAGGQIPPIRPDAGDPARATGFVESALGSIAGKSPPGSAPLPVITGLHKSPPGVN